MKFHYTWTYTRQRIKFNIIKVQERENKDKEGATHCYRTKATYVITHSISVQKRNLKYKIQMAYKIIQV